MTTQTSRLVIEIDSRNAERNARAIANELQNIQRNGDFASRSVDSMSVATRGLAGYMAGLVTVGAAIAKMDTYTGLQNRLKLVTDSQKELNQAMDDTFKIAQNTGSAWDSVAMVYQRFADNADRLGISMSKTAELTETVSKAIAISGGNAASAEAALTQFGQALASGVLRGEEFNSIAEQAPGLLKAIAFGMDVNIGRLRAMAADGKITGDALVAALSKAQPHIDDLFSKTDFTIANSLTQLSNAVTQFVGEAGKGSGAASLLSESISGLAKNLGTVADIAVVGGVAMLTKAILTQTVAMHGAVVESAQRRASLLSELQAQATLSASEVRRTGAIAQLTAMQLADAKATAARMSGMQRLAYVQNVVIPLEARATQATVAHTAATASDTIVQNANNAARSRGAALLRLVGGPIGAITIGVAALAAGYMYLKDRTAEANAKLEEQGRIAEKTDKELRGLSGNDKISAAQDLTAAFTAQNKALDESKKSVDAVLFAIRAVSVENGRARKITEDARRGIISYDEAIKLLNKEKIPTHLYDELRKQAFQYDENSEKAGRSQRVLKIFGIEVTLTGNASQNAAVQHNAQANAIDGIAAASERAQKALSDLNSKKFDAQYIIANTKVFNGDIEKAKALLEYRNQIGIGSTGRQLNKDEMLKFDEYWKEYKRFQDLEDSISKSKRDQTKELEKQAKITQRLIGISGNSGIGTGAHLDVRYGGSRDGQRVSSEHLKRLQAGGKSLSSYQVSSDYGKRKAPAKGASTFHKGIDFAMPVNTPITTNVAVKDVKTAYDSKGGGYYSTVTFEDGVVLKLLHQAPLMMSKIKGGASDGTLKANQDVEKEAERQASTQLQLRMAVATEIKRIETQLQEDIKELNKAGFSPEETKRLVGEYQARADNDVAIAEYALKTKLDDYSSFKKAEDELLKDSFDQKKFYATHDIELSKDQRNQAIKFLNEQHQHELGLMMLAKEEHIFQMQQGLMHANARANEYWNLERQRIALSVKDLAERNKQLAIANSLQAEEKGTNFNTAVQQWGGINVELTGTTDQFNLEKERFDRLAASQTLFDAELAMAGENYALKEQAYQAHVDRMSMIEGAYQTASFQMQLGYGAQMASGVSTMMGAIFGEKSKAYAAAFAIEKAFAVAQAALALGQNIAQASSIGFPQNIPMIAGAVAQGAQIASIIASVAAPAGYADGGFTGAGGKFDPAGIVHKGEVVWSQEDIKRWGGVSVVEAMRTSQPPKGYSDGGIVSTPKDTYRVGMGTVDAINRGADIQAERQAQAAIKAQSANPQKIMNNLRVIMVKDEDEAKDMLYGPDGEKAFLYHQRRNRSKA
ncbi:tape measure protein [Acinetobacter sp. WCHAc010034]|uniref:tape measure protein n=1 Tax=Acinetobacter sp. WCHAc010034 TaxID=1879049 RepID=UPI00083A4B40|nr:tape measure protein [Acinetobacter sp. WCHAc010034]AYA02098.1 tape measure protein [Acinetobacter sp. WCHAc010034]